METELQKLIVTLAGDGTGYMEMLRQAQASTQETVDKVKKGGEDVEKFGDRLKGFASTVVSTLAGIGLSIGVFSAFGKFSQYEEGVIRMNAAIEANGGNVQAATAQYMKFADELERTTMLSKGQVMGMLRQAETMGMAGEAAQRTTKFAAGFAAALGEAPEHAMTLAIAMERGNVHMLRRIPALRGITNEQELLKKAQDLANQGMKVSMDLSLTAAGRLEKLKQGVGKLAKDVGGLVADALMPLINAGKVAVDWFNSLDSGVRKLVAGVLMGIAFVPVLAQAWGYLGTVVTTVKTSFNLLLVAMKAALLNPYALALAAAITLVYVALKTVADAMGGWDKLWGAVRGKAGEFWAWFEPTWKKLKEVGLAAWGAIKAAGMLAWGVIKDAVAVVWHLLQQLWATVQSFAESIGLSGIGVDLDNIIELLHKVTFGFQNFQKIATYVWTVVRFYAVKFYEDTAHFFTVQLPELGAWFLNNWMAIWTDAVNFSTTVIGNLASNVVSVITNIPNLISGTVRWDEVWRPLTEGFQSALGGLPELTEREMTQLEGQLMAEWTELGAEINEGWEDFRRRRLEEMRREDVAAQNSDTRDQQLTQNKKDRHLKLDSVLSGSAEALARAAEFSERMAEGRERTQGALGAGAAPVAPGAGQNIGDALRNAFGGGAGIWDNIRDRAQQIWDSIRDWAFERWDNIRDYALSRWEQVRDGVLGFFAGLPDAIIQMWLGLPDLVLELFSTVADGLLGIWDSIDWTSVMDELEKFFFETMPDVVTTGIGVALAGLWAAIQLMFNPSIGAEQLSNFFSQGGERFGAFFSGLGDRLYDFNKGVWDRISALASDAWNRIVARVTNGLFGSEGGPFRQLGETVRRATGSEGNGQGWGQQAVNQLQTIGTTLQGIGNRPVSVLENLGLPNFGG